jgi:hypothetical protein
MFSFECKLQLTFYIPGRGDVFTLRQSFRISSAAHSAYSLLDGCVPFPYQQSGRSVKLTTQMHIVQTLKMSDVKTPRPLHNFPYRKYPSIKLFGIVTCIEINECFN